MSKHRRHPIIMVLAIYSLIMKAISLRRAFRNRDRNWFWLLALSNTLGVLDYIYIKRKNRHSQVPTE